MQKMIRKLCVPIVFILMPAIVFLVSEVVIWRSLLACVLLLACSFILFISGFSGEKIKTSEWVGIIVFCVLAIILRCAFLMLDQFKPMAGFVIIAGICMGPFAGLLCGMISGFASGLLLGYGAWVPIQMYVFGLGGFIFGAFSVKGILSGEKAILPAVASGAYIMLIGGPLLDVWSMAGTRFINALGVFAAGVPFNAVHAAATVLTVFLLLGPIYRKMLRMRIKYGLMEGAFADEV